MVPPPPPPSGPPPYEPAPPAPPPAAAFPFALPAEPRPWVASPAARRGRLAVGLASAVVAMGVFALVVVGHRVPPLGTTATSHYTDPAGVFSASFPGTPESTDAPVTPGGIPLTVHLVGATVEGTSYYVGYTEFPAAAIAGNAGTTLQGSVAGAASAVRGTVTGETHTTYQGFSAIGYTVTVDDPSAHIQGINILGAHRLFTVYEVVPSGDSAPVAFADFEASLRILEP